jgi:hypothetical protein
MGHGGAVALSVSDLPGALQIDAELRTDILQPSGKGISLKVDTPKARGLSVSMANVAPGRWRAELPEAGPGLYAIQVADERAVQRHLHLRRHRGEDRAWGTNPDLEKWRRAGLVSSWNPGLLRSHLNEAGADHPFDRTLIGLALVLFLSGVAVDRVTLKRTGFGSKFLTWWTRAKSRLW